MFGGVSVLSVAARGSSKEVGEETGRTDGGGGRGLQEVHFRQAGDWSMWEPLALLTGHFCSLNYLQLLGAN